MCGKHFAKWWLSPAFVSTTFLFGCREHERSNQSDTRISTIELGSSPMVAPKRRTGIEPRVRVCHSLVLAFCSMLSAPFWFTSKHLSGSGYILVPVDPLRTRMIQAGQAGWISHQPVIRHLIIEQKLKSQTLHENWGRGALCDAGAPLPFPSSSGFSRSLRGAKTVAPPALSWQAIGLSDTHGAFFAEQPQGPQTCLFLGPSPSFPLPPKNRCVEQTLCAIAKAKPQGELEDEPAGLSVSSRLLRRLPDFA